MVAVGRDVDTLAGARDLTARTLEGLATSVGAVLVDTALGPTDSAVKETVGGVDTLPITARVALRTHAIPGGARLGGVAVVAARSTVFGVRGSIHAGSLTGDFAPGALQGFAVALIADLVDPAIVAARSTVIAILGRIHTRTVTGNLAARALAISGRTGGALNTGIVASSAVVVVGIRVDTAPFTGDLVARTIQRLAGGILAGLVRAAPVAALAAVVVVARSIDTGAPTTATAAGTDTVASCTGLIRPTRLVAPAAVVVVRTRIDARPAAGDLAAGTFQPFAIAAIALFVYVALDAARTTVPPTR